MNSNSISTHWYHRALWNQSIYLPSKPQGFISRSSPLSHRRISVNESVREAGVFVVQTGSPNVNDMLMELMFLLTTCKAKSAASVCAVVPHFPYARQ
ncbi:hypothetical protein SARC_14586, partial [Sphaeroforma arctica JP610]